MVPQRITQGYEHYGGARDGEKIPYRVSDLVITPNSSLVTGKVEPVQKGTKIKKEHTRITPLSVDDCVNS